MKLFKSIDEKLFEIGFSKVEDNSTIVVYERYCEKFNYIHRIELVHKEHGSCIILSFQKGLNKDGFNNVVGLTAYESKLCIKKMKSKNWLKEERII